MGRIKDFFEIGAIQLEQMVKVQLALLICSLSEIKARCGGTTVLLQWENQKGDLF